MCHTCYRTIKRPVVYAELVFHIFAGLAPPEPGAAKVAGLESWAKRILTQEQRRRRSLQNLFPCPGPPSGRGYPPFRKQRPPGSWAPARDLGDPPGEPDLSINRRVPRRSEQGWRLDPRGLRAATDRPSCSLRSPRRDFFIYKTSSQDPPRHRARRPVSHETKPALIPVPFMGRDNLLYNFLVFRAPTITFT